MKLSLDAVLTFIVLFVLLVSVARQEVRWSIYKEKHQRLIEMVNEKSSDRFTRTDAIKYGVIPATQP